MTELECLPSLARAAVDADLRGAPAPETGDLPAALLADGASFVTLTWRGELRGCIGSLQARRPLAVDVMENAKNAAFGDPRFPPVRLEELPELVFEVSVLSAPTPFPVESEEDLLQRVRPGVDGLILEEGSRRATFLPAVWEQLPDPRDFLAQLKRKAGLPGNYWSNSLRVERYHAEKVSEMDSA